jgi:hypothetical protein
MAKQNSFFQSKYHKELEKAHERELRRQERKRRRAEGPQPTEKRAKG